MSDILSRHHVQHWHQKILIWIWFQIDFLPKQQNAGVWINKIVPTPNQTSSASTELHLWSCIVCVHCQATPSSPLCILWWSSGDRCATWVPWLWFESLDKQIKELCGLSHSANIINKYIQFMWHKKHCKTIHGFCNICHRTEMWDNTTWCCKCDAAKQWRNTITTMILVSNKPIVL